MRSGWIVLAIVWVSTSCVWGNDRFPGTEQGAKDLLATFVQPGADLKALTQSLRPKAEDYEKVFMPEIAKKMQTMYAEPWEKGLIVVAPKQDRRRFSCLRPPVKNFKSGPDVPRNIFRAAMKN